MRYSLLVILAALPLCAADAVSSKAYGGAQTQEIIRLRLDRGDLLLESIQSAIQAKGIQDGAVLTGVGTLQECTYHFVTSLAAKAEEEFKTVKGPMEILSITGLIAAGEPHLHITLSDKSHVFGGHLEKGCRVLYRGEITIAKFSGAPLERKLNREGVPMLQPK
jgi:uncharacterized protein